MLTAGENERLTHLGPGTPGGELLRRYGHPISVAQELTEENPNKFVRILGVNLVLFHEKTGQIGDIFLARTTDPQP
jgi:5,5'-dehydrodivanillate O-demethylase